MTLDLTCDLPHFQSCYFHSAFSGVANGMRFFETASEVDLFDSGARRLVKQFSELK